MLAEAGRFEQTVSTRCGVGMAIAHTCKELLPQCAERRATQPLDSCSNVRRRTDDDSAWFQHRQSRPCAALGVTMKFERTLYDILEVSQFVTPNVLRAAYRSLVQSLHPDKNSGTDASGERSAEINTAYSVLSDPVKRLRYDGTLGLQATRIERRGVKPSGDAWFGQMRTGKSMSRPFGFRPLD
jgi:DnaJ-domain-containing protein 1